MPYSIRMATLGDVPALTALIEASVRRLSIGYYTPRQIESALQYVFGVDTQLISDGTYYVAEAEGQLVGCGGWSKRSTLFGGDQTKAAEDPLLDPAQHPGRIRAFFVLPQWARRGIGRAIIHFCEKAAYEAGFRQLELAATLPGEPLYRGLGYLADEHFALTFPNGERLPLIRMHKDLTAAVRTSSYMTQIPHRRLALIDLGTNTFHLLIVEMPAVAGDKPLTLLRTKAGVRLGEGGISQGIIAPEAYARALHTLAGFKEEIELHEVKEIRATATSAMRVTRNGPDLVRDIFEQTGIQVDVIPGEREAELICAGVRQAVDLGADPSLIMDIGGGSVEFIVANHSTIFWKQSFEIGAQRLLDLFFPDPSGIFPAAAVEAEQEYLSSVLTPLVEAVHRYKPVSLVGASGSFDSLADMQLGRLRTESELPPCTELEVGSFQASHRHLLSGNHEQRLALPGILPMRADMLVVASVLIDFVLGISEITRIRTSAYALKEGLLAEMLAA
ncbi:GNAT family N-acetyltransferase [Hymenobacter sedentarius]|nr:GNAT family N-acetyltransferase [Hymenobacter sedentarius]